MVSRTTLHYPANMEWIVTSYHRGDDHHLYWRGRLGAYTVTTDSRESLTGAMARREQETGVRKSDDAEPAPVPS